MFGVGPEELVLILIIALIVLGPERMPKVARDLGRVALALSVFLDIPKHQFSFPFPPSCPGICLNLGPIQVNQEIKTHLGLDLQGGTQLLLQMNTGEIPAGQSVADYNDRARRVIDRRINGLGVSEPVIQAVGDDKILLQLPGIDDLQKANDLATQQAKLEIKIPDAANPGQYKSLTPPLTGEHLNPTYVAFDSANQPVVHFEFTGDDANRWIQLSKDFLQQPVQITLDGKQISAPVIQNLFTSGSGEISGNFTVASAKDLSSLINSGALPVSLTVIQSSRVEPTLGRQSVDRSLIAGAMGLLLVAFGTGTVKGFALTLGIGVAVSFFTAVVVTQMLLHGAIEFSSLRRRWLYGVEERAVETPERHAPRPAPAL